MLDTLELHDCSKLGLFDMEPMVHIVRDMSEPMGQLLRHMYIAHYIPGRQEESKEIGVSFQIFKIEITKLPFDFDLQQYIDLTDTVSERYKILKIKKIGFP